MFRSREIGLRGGANKGPDGRVSHLHPAPSRTPLLFQEPQGDTGSYKPLRPHGTKRTGCWR